MTTSTHETEIVADPTVPLARIIREFDAPPAKVFRARYVLASGGAEFGFHGSFHEVRPAELIVQTFTFEGEPDGVALERLVFDDLGTVARG